MTSSPPEARPHLDAAWAYIDDVLSGRRAACRYVRQACQRQRRELSEWESHPVFFFDEKAAERVCRFVERLPHVKGPKASLRQLLRLQPWQCFVLTTVFGWRRRDTGGRRYRRVYLELPRGQGKSLLASAVALYCLLADGEAGAEVYSAATTEGQARIVWSVAKAMLEKRPDFRRKLGAVINEQAILQPSSHSVFAPMSREAKTQEGANIHCAVIDELHAHRTREVYDVVETGTSKRLSSLLWVITTAGSDTSGICYEVRAYGLKVLEGAVDDPSQFALVYTLDEGDLWTAPSTWEKANPNWGVSVMPDNVEALALKAMQVPSAQSAFLTKHLNVWVNADSAWMDMAAWDRCGDSLLSEGDFTDEACWIGLDLASRTDMGARVKLFRRLLPKPSAPGRQPEEEEMEAHYYAFLCPYLPEAAVESGRNASYRGWQTAGQVLTTPGDVLDFGQVRRDVLEDASRHQVRAVAYDPWQATQLAGELSAEGLTCVEVRPTVQNFSAPMKELDALVRSGRFHHDSHPVLRWHVSNVVCHTDAKDNVYPRKERPETKIDGVVALIMALNRALLSAEPETGPYESRGIRMIG